MRGTWTRAGAVTVRLCVRASPHGKGLFAGGELHSGQTLGRLWGEVVCERVTFETCRVVGRRMNSNRLVALQSGRDAWNLLHVGGCVFEWCNHADEDDEACNIAVSPTGVVTATRSVEKGDELRWDYGTAFWA